MFASLCLRSLGLIWRPGLSSKKTRECLDSRNRKQRSTPKRNRGQRIKGVKSVGTEKTYWKLLTVSFKGKVNLFLMKSQGQKKQHGYRTIGQVNRSQDKGMRQQN